MIQRHAPRSIAMAVCTILAGSAAPAQAIVQGREADPGQAPFAVALVYHGADPATGLFCGGALVAPDVVLTAAHCTVGQRPGAIDVLVGRQRLDGEEGERLQVMRITRHPGHRRGTDVHDFAALRLAQSATTGSAIGLPDRRTAPGTRATVFGWGRTSPHADVLADSLLTTDLIIRSDRFCFNRYDGNYTPRDALCASGGDDNPRAGVCEGDSGGPLIAGDPLSPVLVGVVSYGAAVCSSRRYPEVFGEVANNLGWIRGQLGAR